MANTDKKKITVTVVEKSDDSVAEDNRGLQSIIHVDPALLSPLWNTTLKAVVGIVALICAVALAWRFQNLIAQIVGAAMLAYVLNPLIVILSERTPIKRTHSILLVYVGLAILVIGSFSALGLAAYGQITGLIEYVRGIIENPVGVEEQFNRVWDSYISGTWDLGFFEINADELFAGLDWGFLQQQLLDLTRPVLNNSVDLIGKLASQTISTTGIIFFIFIISIYIANDIPRMGEYVSRLTHAPGYSHDAERLSNEFGNIWRAYLRGQIILGLVIGVVVWLTLALLGVQNAFALGVLSGMLEFIPIIGPFIGAGAAILVALFQPENYLGLSPIYHALAVLVAMVIIQQVENNLLVPRIVGNALNMHPLLVMVSVFMGASIAGVVGAILAAPVVASCKLVGIYAWRKMFDLPPFPDEENELSETEDSAVDEVGETP